MMDWRKDWRIGAASILLALFLILVSSVRAMGNCDFEGAVSAYIFYEDTWQEEIFPVTFADRAWLDTIGEFTIPYRTDQPEYFDIPDDLVYIDVTLSMPDGTHRYLWIGRNDGDLAYVWAANSLVYMANYHLRDTCAQQVVDADTVTWR